MQQLDERVVSDYNRMILSDLRRKKKCLSLENTLFPSRQITPYGKLMYAAVLFKSHASDKQYCTKIGELVVFFNVHSIILEYLKELASVLKTRKAVKEFFAVVLLALPDNDKHKSQLASVWEQVSIK